MCDPHALINWTTPSCYRRASWNALSKMMRSFVRASNETFTGIRQKTHGAIRSPIWTIKEPMLTWYLPALRALGAARYVHVIRSIRNLRHPHYEIDSRFWLAYHGGERGLAAAVTAALRSVEHELNAVPPGLLDDGQHNGSLDHAGARVAHEVQKVAFQSCCGQPCATLKGDVACQKPLDWLIFVQGWTHVHQQLIGWNSVEGQPTNATLRAIDPWIYPMRAERLWAPRSCREEMRALLTDLGLPASNSALQRCNLQNQTRVTWPPPRPTLPLGMVLGQDVVGAIAGPILRQMGYE